MRRTLLLLLAACAPIAVACSAPEPEAEGPAYAWHDSVMAATGGKKAWERARYIQFRWNLVRDGQIVGDRMHYWDRRDGRYRVEVATGPSRSVMRSNQSVVVIFDLETKEGRVWIDGQEFAGSMGATMVEDAFSWFADDSFALLMPFLWRDPGVNLEHLGADSDEAGNYQVVRLSFDDSGLQPGSQYWVYVDAASPHLVRKWQHQLQGREDKSTFFRWEQWQQFGDVMLATERNPVDGSYSVRFTDVQVSTRVPAGIFEPPQN
jgi:hypothetical protein